MRIALWLTLLVVPALASAQTTPSAAPQPAVRVMSIEPTQTVSFDTSLVQLRARLNPNAEQQPAWLRYANSVDAYARLFFEEKPQSAFPNEAAPRQLERMNTRIRARMAALQAIEAEGKALYAQLDAVQQKTADQHLLGSIPSFGFSPPAH